MLLTVCNKYICCSGDVCHLHSISSWQRKARRSINERWTYRNPVSLQWDCNRRLTSPLALRYVFHSVLFVLLMTGSLITTLLALYLVFSICPCVCFSFGADHEAYDGLLEVFMLRPVACCGKWPSNSYNKLLLFRLSYCLFSSIWFHHRL